jgi:hypothetical protein
MQRTAYLIMIFSLSCIPSSMHGVYQIIQESLFSRLLASMAITSFEGSHSLEACQFWTNPYLFDKKYEDSLVSLKYPYAQAWYEEIAQKYPQLHFENKVFMKSAHNYDYYSYIVLFFSSQVLARIDCYYKKKMNGQSLDKREAACLEKYEWMLVSDATKIENYDTVKNYSVWLSLLLAREATAYTLENMLQDRTALYDTLEEMQSALNWGRFYNVTIFCATCLAVQRLYRQYKNYKNKLTDDCVAKTMHDKKIDNL